MWTVSQSFPSREKKLQCVLARFHFYSLCTVWLTPQHSYMPHSQRRICQTLRQDLRRRFSHLYKLPLRKTLWPGVGVWTNSSCVCFSSVTCTNTQCSHTHTVQALDCSRSHAIYWVYLSPWSYLTTYNQPCKCEQRLHIPLVLSLVLIGTEDEYTCLCEHMFEMSSWMY